MSVQRAAMNNGAIVIPGKHRDMQSIVHSAGWTAALSLEGPSMAMTPDLCALSLCHVAT